MMINRECRDFSLQELKNRSVFSELPRSVLLSAFIISGDDSFLLQIPNTTSEIFKQIKEESFSILDACRKLLERVDGILAIGTLKEMYLSCITDQETKLGILSLTLELQKGIKEMLGYYYDQSMDFIISSIQNKVDNQELKTLLAKRSNTEELKRKLLSSQYIDFTIAELLHITKDNELICLYVFSRSEFNSQQEKNIFRDLLKAISDSEVERLDRENIPISTQSDCQVVNFKKNK
jgi:hypothetical protein